ncbi:putative synaptojanin [Anopheles sinensis]|uniref:Putative synaptojanin n=1 Tax=Anopheles sinensis TaxID=74873 RepID=A0A084VM08_ANOSI|nr:putative synaptojanin [Anopheles sinensis]
MDYQRDHQPRKEHEERIRSAGVPQGKLSKPIVTFPAARKEMNRMERKCPMVDGLFSNHCERKPKPNARVNPDASAMAFGIDKSFPKPD